MVFAAALAGVVRMPTISRFASGPMAIGALRTGLYSAGAASDWTAAAAQAAQASSHKTRPVRGIGTAPTAPPYGARARLLLVGDQQSVR